MRQMQLEMYPTRKEQRNNREKQINTIFNEVRQFAYVLEVREREILLIQQSTQTNTEGYLRDLPWIQYMRAITLIYSHRIPGI